MSEDVSRRVTQAAFHGLAGAGTDGVFWFKKIDSVLRGHSLSETIVLFRTGGFDHLVFAPAFPELGRITVGGQHLVEEGNPRERRPAACGSFQGKRSRSSGAAFRGNNLDRRGARRRIGERLPGKILWCGSGGLALALAGGRPFIRPPALAAVITGTRHPVTLRQVEHLAARIKPESGPPIHAPSMTSASPAHTALQLEELGRSLMIYDPGNEAIAVIGGDSLASLLRAMQAEELRCLGEVARGVPISRVRGGRLDGLALLTKSGGFGSDDLLTRLALQMQDFSGAE